MTISHATATRNAQADAVVDLLNSGKLVFFNSASASVAVLVLGATAFGDASNGSAVANSITDDSSATAGNIESFALLDSGDGTVVYGSVTATGGGGDLELTSISANTGDIVSVTTLRYSAPQ